MITNETFDLVAKCMGENQPDDDDDHNAEVMLWQQIVVKLAYRFQAASTHQFCPRRFFKRCGLTRLHPAIAVSFGIEADIS